MIGAQQSSSTRGKGKRGRRRFPAENRWVPFAGGILAIGVLSLWAGLALPSGTAAEVSARPEAQEVPVIVSEIPLVCPPGIVDPDKLTKQGASFNAGVALGSWVPGATEPLVGGGEALLISGDAAAEGISGVSLAGIDEGDLLSFIVESCQIPNQDLAFAAGATTVGEDTVLVMSNPTENAATVHLQIFGSLGQVLEVPADIVVPSLSTVSVLPGAWAPGEDSPVITVNVEGAGIGAWLQTSALEGEVPLGVARVQGAVPHERLVLAGISKSDTASLRIGNLGVDATQVEISVLTEDGEIPLPGAESTPVEAKSVLTIDLAGVGAAAHAIVVQGDQPLIATITETTAGAKHPDVKNAHYSGRTVVGPTYQITGAELVDVEDLVEEAKSLGFSDVEVALAVANPDDTAAEVTLQGTTRSLPAASSVLYPILPTLPTTQLTADRPVFAAYVVTAQTPAGPVRSVTSLGTEGILAQTRLVSLLPDHE